MGWKDWPYWLRGGLIGLSVSIFLIVILSGCSFILSGEEGMACIIPGLPLYYTLSFTGLDFFVIFIPLENQILIYCIQVILVSIFLFIVGGYMGLLFDRKINWKKKLIVFIILLLIFSPLTIYNKYLKYNDEKIINAITTPTHGMIVDDVKICDDISNYNTYEKNKCYGYVIKNTGDLSICDKLSYGYKSFGKGCKDF